MAMKRETRTRNAHLRSHAMRGFTLIEMMVSVAIFTLVLAASVGTLFSIVESNRKVQSTRVAMDSLDLILEEMTRNITQGQNYNCGDVGLGPLSCPLTPASSFRFDSNDVGVGTVTYSLVGDKIVKTTSVDGSTDLTTNSVFKVTGLRFYVFNAEDADTAQPRVLVSVTGETLGKYTADFFVQTTVSQRVPK